MNTREKQIILDNHNLETSVGEYLLPTQLLRQKPLARECADWIKGKVAIRTIKQINFLHGKMYRTERHASTGLPRLIRPASEE